MVPRKKRMWKKRLNKLKKNRKMLRLKKKDLSHKILKSYKLWTALMQISIVWMSSILVMTILNFSWKIYKVTLFCKKSNKVKKKLKKIKRKSSKRTYMPCFLRLITLIRLMMSAWENTMKKNRKNEYKREKYMMKII